MCEKSEVAPAYNNGFERKKVTAVKIFCLMTLVFLIALIPVSENEKHGYKMLLTTHESIY